MQTRATGFLKKKVSVLINSTQSTEILINATLLETQ